MLEPGETADILAVIANNGNEPALGLTGFLTSNSNEITINTQTADYGDVQPDQNTSAPYNVMLSNAVMPGNVSIPFNLLITDEDGRHSSFNFVYEDRCVVVFDLLDGYGDGWNNNKLVVNFDDNSPAQTFTINSGFSATYSIEKNAGVTISLSWITGSYVDECSFKIYYQGGDNIFASSGYPGSGTFFSWVMNCSKTVNCDPISDLSVAIINSIAEITWVPPTSAIPNYYEIYQNLESVGTTTDTDFSTPISEGDYKFCVYAIFDHCLIPQCISASVSVLECPPPLDINHTVYSNGIVTVNWNKPIDDTNLVGYNIFINDEFVEMLTEETFTFEATEEGMYDFCVTALHQIDDIDCESEPICENLNVIINVEAPVNLTATVLSESEIELAWEYSNLRAIFTLFRDDGSIIEENIENLQFIDIELSTDIEYCYVVKAVLGKQVSEPSNEACAIIVGIEEHSASNLKVYPNPSNSMIHIEGQGIENITIINAMGQTVKIVKATNDITHIDVSNFTTGNYVLSVSCSDGSNENIKVVIK
jgi:hypothetical protein